MSSTGRWIYWSLQSRPLPNCTWLSNFKLPSICSQARLKVSFTFIAKHFQHRRGGKCYFSFNLPPFSARGIVGDQVFPELLLAPFCSALSIRLCNFKLKSICLQAMLKDPFTLIEKYFQHRKAGRHLVSLNHPAFPVRSESVLARFCSAQMAWFWNLSKKTLANAQSLLFFLLF